MEASGAPSSFLKPSPEGPTFELVKEIGKDVWLAVRQGDPRREQYLARPFEAYRGPQGNDNTKQHGDEGPNQRYWKSLLDDGKQGDAVAEILNHENLVSLVGRIDHHPFSRTQEDDSQLHNRKTYLVWDFCDAGNLSALFAGNKAPQAPEYYLPESLCWHVLKSLIRAVAHLHDGLRLHQHPSKGYNAIRDWVRSPDTDWLPILHRNIEPANIFFQQPRGSETYGKCKLGNFSHVTVTGHVIRGPGEPLSHDTRPPGVAINRFRGHEPLHSLLCNKYRSEWDGFPKAVRLYELRHELWAIGSIIFTMMTGSRPTFCCDECGCCHIVRCRERGCIETEAQQNGCKCTYGGCRHQSEDDCDHTESVWWKPCPPSHHCEKPTINIDTYLARSNYSIMLRNAVRKLTDFDPKLMQHIESVYWPWMFIEDQYRSWRANTDEGRQYRDLEDDLIDRWNMMNTKAHEAGKR